MIKEILTSFINPYKVGLEPQPMPDPIPTLPPPISLPAATYTQDTSAPEANSEEEPFRFTVEDMRECLFNEDGTPDYEAAHDLAIYLIDVIDWTARCLDTDLFFNGRPSIKPEDKAWNATLIPKLWLWTFSRTYNQYPTHHTNSKYEFRPVLNFYASAPDLVRESLGNFIGQIKRKVYS